MTDEEARQLRAENARLRLQQQFPQADWELIAQVAGDSPQTIELMARRTHESALAARSAAGAPGPAPVPSANDATAAPSESEMQIRRWQVGARSRNRHVMLDPQDAELARAAFFRMSWNRHMEHRRRGHGDVSEPAPFVAPSATVLPLPGTARVS